MKLPDLIARVESAGRPWAMRFEPAVWERRGKHASMINAWEPAKRANHCSGATADVINATSWGLYQIMGFNLYGRLGLDIPVGEFLAHPEVQFSAFRMYCERARIWTPDDVPLTDDLWLHRFAVAYNGPGAPDAYVKRMREEANRLDTPASQPHITL